MVEVKTERVCVGYTYSPQFNFRFILVIIEFILQSILCNNILLDEKSRETNKNLK